MNDAIGRRDSREGPKRLELLIASINEPKTIPPKILRIRQRKLIKATCAQKLADDIKSN